MVDLKSLLPSRKNFADCEYWECRLETEMSTTIRVKNGEVDVVNEKETGRGSARALFRGGWGFSSFNRLDSAVEHARGAVENARTVGGGKAAVLSLPAVEVSLEARFEQHPASVPLARKLEVARRYDALLREHARVEMSDVYYGDAVRRRVFFNAEGRLIEEEEIITRGALAATGLADGVPETHGVSTGHRGGFEEFLELEKKLPTMLRELEEQLAAQDARGGRYDCVINPLMAGVFAHEAFGHTSEADFFYRDPRQQEVMRLGRSLGSRAITIVDDPSVDRRYGGSIQYDDEGVEAARTILLEKGVLTSHLHSRATAQAMGEGMNGRARALSASLVPQVRMTNTFVAPGEATRDDLLATLKNGLLVIDSRGGTGGEDFTFNARMGYLVENGKTTRPIKNFTLTGNLFETLENVVACSDEMELFSSGTGGCGKGGQYPLPVGLGGASVLIKNALIGGR